MISPQSPSSAAVATSFGIPVIDTMVVGPARMRELSVHPLAVAVADLEGVWLYTY